MTDSHDKPLGDPGSTSLGLLHRARAGDPDAWQRLVALYSPLIDRWCQSAGLREADASDVRQEVFLGVNRTLANFRQDQPGATFRGWLRTITQRKVCDHLRRLNPGGEPPGGSDAYEKLLNLSDSASADGDTQAAELSVLYRRALDLMATDFAEKTWRAFWLVVVEGRTPAEAAGELRLTVNAVYLAKGRVLARLREEFADLIDT